MIQGLSPDQLKKYRIPIERGYFDDYSPEWVAGTFAGAFLYDYPQLVTTFERLADVVGHTPTWSDLTDYNLVQFIEQMRKEGVGQNSMKTYCASLKRALEKNRFYHDIPSRNFRDILRIKEIPSEAVFLTRDEIERLHLYNVTSQKEKRYKAIFMISILTGARMSDAVLLTKNNIDPYSRYLHYIQQKTKKRVSVPVDDWLCEYLPDNPDELSRYSAVYSADMTSWIRHACIDCHIDRDVTVFKNGRNRTMPKYAFVSPHTARRSFATNLYLSGVEVEEIRLLMGHATENMTRHYIVAERPVSLSTARLFQRQKSIPCG